MHLYVGQTKYAVTGRLNGQRLEIIGSAGPNQPINLALTGIPLDLLTALLDKIEPTGIISAERQEAEAVHGEAFCLLQADEIKPEMTTGEKLNIIIQRFEASATLQAEANLLKADYKAATGEEWQARPIAAQAPARLSAQLAADLETITPDLDRILDPQGGALKHGAKSLIAKLLGGQPAGHFYRKRVEPLVAHLERDAPVGYPSHNYKLTVE